MKLGLLLAVALAQASTSKPVNLLSGITPKFEKAANVERMTDGIAPEPGDEWQSAVTSVVEKEGSVTWDLGTSKAFEGVWIQADNNDVYTISTSEDGTHFIAAWESSTVDNPGMQVRTSTTTKGQGRYIKLTAAGGDGLFSVGELALFEKGDDAKAYTPNYKRTAPPPQPFDGNWIVIAVVLAGLVFLVRRMKDTSDETTPEGTKAAEPPEDAPAKSTEPDKK